MIKAKKYDGVIEAVHYTLDGKIDWVRGYQRRGFVFSDMLILDRETLLTHLEDGDRIYIGQRQALMGNDFALGEVVRVEKQKSGEKIVAGKAQGDGDFLAGTPVY